MSLTITLIGGPTALLEIDGVRIVTDPTFDAPGSYQLPHVTLEKLEGPALTADSVGEIDAVLLSHDQHADNLDHSGKEFLAKAKPEIVEDQREREAEVSRDRDRLKAAYDRLAAI